MHDSYKDVPQTHQDAIQHYLNSGHHEGRLGYVEGHSFQGRWTVSNGKDLFISVSSRMGGSIDSLVWNNVQFINMYDHGRELQMAANSDVFGECYNPTEAGGSSDGKNLNTKTQIQWIHAHNRTLESEARGSMHSRSWKSKSCRSWSFQLGH